MAAASKLSTGATTSCAARRATGQPLSTLRLEQVWVVVGGKVDDAAAGADVGGGVVDGDSGGAGVEVATAPGVLPGRAVPHPKSVDVIISARAAVSAVREPMITVAC
jgi:hypothetical protein